MSIVPWQPGPAPWSGNALGSRPAAKVWHDFRQTAAQCLVLAGHMQPECRGCIYGILSIIYPGWYDTLLRTWRPHWNLPHLFGCKVCVSVWNLGSILHVRARSLRWLFKFLLAKNLALQGLPMPFSTKDGTTSNAQPLAVFWLRRTLWPWWGS